MNAPRPVLALLSLTMGSASCAMGMLGTLVPLAAFDLGLSPTALGLLVALPSAFPVALALSAGRWVDQGGPGRWLSIGMAGTLAATLLLLGGPGTAALAVAQLLVGVFNFFATLSAQSLVAGLQNGRSHQRNFSTFTTVLSFGRMLGPLLAGLMVDLAGYPAAFALLSATCAVALVLAEPVRRVTAGLRSEVARAAGSLPRGALFTLRHVGLQLAVLASTGILLAVAVRQAFLPAMLLQQGVSATTVGGLVSVVSLSAVLIRPLMPPFVRLLGGPARTLVVVMVAAAVGVGLSGVLPSVPALVVLGLVTGVGSGVGFPLSIVTVASHVPLRERGQALGLRLSLNHAVELVMPVLGGGLIALVGFSVGFGVVGILLGVFAVLAALRVRRFEASEAVG